MIDLSNVQPNVGGGCGAPDCDYQVGCSACMDASWDQVTAWESRHGYKRGIPGEFDRMRGADYTEALSMDLERLPHLSD